MYVIYIETCQMSSKLMSNYTWKENEKNIVGGGGWDEKNLFFSYNDVAKDSFIYIYFKNSEILLFSILENRTANIYAGLLFVKKR